MYCMNNLPSSQFRLIFSRLTEPTTVTVNGHLIGTWLPGAHGARVARDFTEIGTPGRPDLSGTTRGPDPIVSSVQYRPAPKPGSKR